jgi:hypothetical protein
MQKSDAERLGVDVKPAWVKGSAAKCVPSIVVCLPDFFEVNPRRVETKRTSLSKTEKT